MNQREHQSLKVTAIITLITLGVAIMAFSLPVLTSLKAEIQRRDSFHHALILEITQNDYEANQVAEEYKKDKKIASIPSFSSTAYEAILNAGMLDNYGDSTQSNLVMMYMQITKLQATYSSSVDAQEIAIVAKTTSTWMHDYSNSFEKKNTLELEKSYYDFWLTVGFILLIVGIGWLWLAVANPKRHNLVAFLTRIKARLGNKRK
jgi:hypothetical protein